ncbi:hypothetical protein BDV27DRAFT_153044 [Aspergillus caelatus]|uniref:Uncharacterized protein n=1 Tax=Aspergillus caelatus TaxID=61420 RepID=A0A5N7AK27_9EURO|nr:uncharacterized protein BDV27DRAFT_153044 [Aspergillus caelatus]KAE8369556.1 hypothetical protein BDV27DRAFT_153044 [Aspergillus caelatus]
MVTNLVKAAVALLFIAIVTYTRNRCRGHKREQSAVSKTNHDATQETQAHRPMPEQLYRDMYFKLHNIEEYPDIIKQGRNVLQACISEALQVAHKYNHPILRVAEFSAAEVYQFLQAEQDAVIMQWRDYLQRRASGQGREMFLSADEARQWLIRRAPMKFVDGAWLGYIHRTTSPYAMRSITKDLWQILSEEIGDGDLRKSHVHVFRQLLRDLDYDPGHADSREFSNNSDMDDPHIWKASILQLLISLSPAEFFPEILGYNMHFEMLTLDTLIVAKELRELNIDPTYFTLHITIDNAHSGHTAIASTAVIKYMTAIKMEHGDAVAKRMWNRVQAGYALSSCSTPGVKGLPRSWYSSLAAEILDIFKAKTRAADGLHDTCPVRIGTKSLGEWMNPQTFESEKSQSEFLISLSNSRPWVYKGDSNRSRIIHSMLWEGRMFGAFTEYEVARVRCWIDSLCKESKEQDFIHNDHFSEQSSPLHGNAVLLDTRISSLPNKIRNLGHVRAPDIPNTREASPLTLTIPRDATVKLERLIPLWMTHPCLLESWVSVPWRIGSSEGCASVRLLRAQHGFTPERSVVDGMDEVRREDPQGLVEIGLDIINQSGSRAPQDLDEVLRWWPSSFAYTLASLAMQPRKYTWCLFGMTQAFVHLHKYLSVHGSVMSAKSQAILVEISAREQIILDSLRDGQVENGPEVRELHAGYAMAKTEVEACFNQD